MNRFCGIGRLTKTPELKYTQSNVAVTNFTIAINRTFTNQSGEREVDFINAVAYRNQAENLVKYQVKGNLISIEGRLQIRKYEDKDGKKVPVAEVIVDNIGFLETKNSQENQKSINDFDNTKPNNVNPYHYDFEGKTNSQIALETMNDPFADFGQAVTIDDNFLE